MVEQKFIIRRLETQDYFYDYIELLKQLTECRDMSYKMFKNIVNEFPENTYIYVIVDEEFPRKVIGTATLFLEQKIIRGGRKVGHIEDVVIDKEYRKYGLGRALIHKLIRLSQEHNCYKVILDCDEQLQEFYQRCGLNKRYTNG